MIHQRYRQTDGRRTERRHVISTLKTALCTVVHRAVMRVELRKPRFINDAWK